MITKRLAITLALLVPGLASASPAEDLWNEGQQKYVLQKWDEAAEAFKKAYELETDETKKPSYLYNVAQAYRMGRSCKKSKFYYSQYLDAKRAKPLKPEKRTEVEGHIASLVECAKAEQDAEDKQIAADKAAAAERAAAERAAKEKAAKDKEIADANDADGDGEDPEDGITKSTDDGQPKLVSARLIGGGSLVTAGSIDIPLQSNMGLIAGYPLKLAPQITLEAGAALTVAPSGYKVGMESRTATFTGVLANAGVTYWVSDKIGVRGDLGVGALVLSNASESPFTGGKPTTGALSMFHARAGASFDYAVTPNILVTVPLVFSFSPAKGGMREDISSITRFDFMLGVGYRM